MSAGMRFASSSANCEASMRMRAVSPTRSRMVMGPSVGCFGTMAQVALRPGRRARAAGVERMQRTAGPPARVSADRLPQGGRRGSPWRASLAADGRTSTKALDKNESTGLEIRKSPFYM